MPDLTDLEQDIPSAPDPGPESVEAVRDRIANTILVLMAIMGLPAILIGLPRSLEFGFRAVQYLLYGEYLLLVAVVIWRRRIPFFLRAILLLAITFVTGVIGIFDWGLFSMYALFFSANILLAALLLGWRVGIAFALAALLAMSAALLSVHIGLISYDVDFNEFAKAPSSWILAMSHIVIFAVVLLIAFGRLFGALTRSVDLLGNRGRELERANLSLEREAVERQRAALVLRDSEQRYRLLAENVTDVIWTMDQDFNLTYVSPSVRALLGFGPDEAAARGFEGLVAPGYREEVKKVVFAELERRREDPESAGRVRTLEFEVVGKDGSTVCTETGARIVGDEAGTPVSVVGVTRDVSERKRLERQLLQSQKMEAVGRLAGGVAHDFNNQLMVILNVTEMLQRSSNADDRQQARQLELLMQAGEKSAALVRQLLAFSRKQIMEPRVVDLNEVLAGLERMLGRLIGEDVRLCLKPDPEPVRVLMDPVQIEQVILNLAVNARDAMPEGGRLVMETEGVDLDPHAAERFNSIGPGRYSLLTVSDTGVGMDRETRERIFEPFFTTKDANKGTGLGLSMVYGIVKQMEGEIFVYSEPGRGTTFKIYLPGADAAGPAAGERPAESPDLKGHERVLVVEDDELVRETTSAILQGGGYDVIEAASGEDALELFEREKDTIDLIVTDVVMTGITGRELACRIQARAPQMRVIFVSGYSQDVVAHHGIVDSGVDFLQKPFTTQALLEKVRQVLDRD